MKPSKNKDVAGLRELGLVVGARFELFLELVVVDYEQAVRLKTVGRSRQVGGLFERFDISVGNFLFGVETLGGVAPFKGFDQRHNISIEVRRLPVVKSRTETGQVSNSCTTT